MGNIFLTCEKVSIDVKAVSNGLSRHPSALPITKYELLILHDLNNLPTIILLKALGQKRDYHFLEFFASAEN